MKLKVAVNTSSLNKQGEGDMLVANGWKNIVYVNIEWLDGLGTSLAMAGVLPIFVTAHRKW